MGNQIRLSFLVFLVLSVVSRFGDGWSAGDPWFETCTARTYKHVSSVEGVEGRGPDLLYIHGRNNAVTRLKLANPCCSGHCAGLEHLLEIQTANRNAENGIAAVECWPLFLSLSAGRSETKGRGETSKLCEKTGIIEKQGWSSCDIPTATDAGYSSFFPSSFFLFFFF